MSKEDEIEDTELVDEIKKPVTNPRARKYGKAGTYFDIKAFKKQLDQCNFPRLSFTLEKRKMGYYITVLSYDPDTEVGVIAMRVKHGTNLDMAIIDLHDISMRYLMQLPQRAKNKHFLP